MRRAPSSALQLRPPHYFTIPKLIHSALIADNYMTMMYTLLRFRRYPNLPDRCTIPMSTLYLGQISQNVTKPALSVLGRCYLYLDVTCTWPRVLLQLTGYLGDYRALDGQTLIMVIGGHLGHWKGSQAMFDRI
jgi:hypothetical protein